MAGQLTKEVTDLINYFAAFAKYGLSRGEPPAQTEQAAIASVTERGYTESQIKTALSFVPFAPEKRIQLLIAQKDDADWERWAASWALQSEIDQVKALLSQPVVTEPQVQVETDVISSSQDPLIARGMLLEEGFRAFGINVSLVPSECSGRGLRCDRFVFSKPLEMAFSTPASRLPEALSNAGLDPELGVNFRKLPKNRFEMQVPRDPSEWKVAHLFTYLSDAAGVRILKNKSVPVDEMITTFTSHLRSLHNILPENPPSVPVLVDLDGNPLWIELSSHVLIGGGSGGGKSTMIKTILIALMLLYPPEWLKFVLMDFKEGLTLDRFAATEWSWQGLDTCNRPENAETYWELLEVEAEKRAGRFKEVGVENLSEYNALNPTAPLPWIVVVIDEVGNYKMSVGDVADDRLRRCMSQWRAWGIVAVGSTQYPSQKHALGPDVRVNFKSRLLFSCDKRCAELVFGEGSKHALDATRLVPPGDCIAQHQGQYVRGQALFVPQHINKRFLEIHAQRILADPLKQSVFAA